MTGLLRVEVSRSALARQGGLRHPTGRGVAAVSRSFSYADAVKLLGGADSKVVTALDRLAGGLLLAAAAGGSGLALSLFEAKGELTRLSMELVDHLSEKLRGLSRFRRTERLAAAQAVLVLVAYFEALEEFEKTGASDPGLHHDTRTLLGQVHKHRLGKIDQIKLATGESPGSSRLKSLIHGLLHEQLPTPQPQYPYEVTLERIRSLYESLSAQMTVHLVGAVLWDQLDGQVQRAFRKDFQEKVTQSAVGRYQDLYGRLATEFPELAFWANLVDHQATRGEIRGLQVGLAGLERVLAKMAEGQIPDDRRDGLARFYRAVLDGPIVETGEVPAEGMRIPALGDSYINPCFRAADVGVRDRPHAEDWWQLHEVRDDVQGFLLGYLTSPQAVTAPLVLLGQPGSGKSVLTKVLAARLPAREFLTVRVVLREVPAEVDLQTQIEHAIRDATGENLSWPDLARTAGDALLVVLLDGFDELVQATGVTQSDYLEKITLFQQREVVQGRPVAVIVTSRIAVADRVRVPGEGTVCVRLEPFSDTQVTGWLSVWNDANASYLDAHGLRPLSHETALRDADLARQPLLLLMLALYDADGNALQNASDEIGHAQLYERLLSRFAEREVRKTHASLDAGQVAQEIRRELLRLSIAAFAMFNRNRQWVTETELNADLEKLQGNDPRPAPSSGFRAPLSAAQLVIGEFFFVHQAQAIRDDARLTTCEFLHATFGEFLVARLVARELGDLAQIALHSTERARSARPDDGYLHALLSFTALSSRTTTIEFLSDLITLMTDDRRAVLRGLLLGLFRTALEIRATALSAYEPVKITACARSAAYSANLLILLVLIGDEVTGRELFPDAEDVVDAWRRQALFWRSQLSVDGWIWLATTLGFRRTGNLGRRDVLIARAPHHLPDDPVDPYWSWDEKRPSDTSEETLLAWQRTDYLRIRREGYFLCDTDQDALIHALDPLATALEAAVTTFAGYWADHCVSASHALIRLWTASGMQASAEELTAAYDDCIEIALTAFSLDTSTQSQYRRIVLRQLDHDRNRLPGVWREKTRQHLEGFREIPELTDFADRVLIKLGFHPRTR
jgi:hypothetical protein